MAQSLLQSGAVHLTGTDLTIAQLDAFIESLEKQLSTHSYDPLAMETTIAPETWRILNAQILNSQTLKNEWDVGTFIKALKELYPSNKMSRFQNNNTFWKQWIEDLKYDLQVIPGKLKLCTFIRKCPLCQLTSQINPLVKVNDSQRQRCTVSESYVRTILAHFRKTRKDTSTYW